MHINLSLRLSASLLLPALLALAPARTHADRPVGLPVPPVAQRFVDPVGGDNGTYDCLPATETMVLQTLAGEQLVKSSDITYASVRAAFRQQVPDAGRLINMTVATRVTQALTGHVLTAVPVETSPDRWQHVVRSELDRGYPIIAAIPDWHLLAAEWPDEGGPVWHAVVITGLSDTTVTYRDPWGADPSGADGGRSYTMTRQALEAAWSGDNGWWALIFSRVNPSLPAVVQLRSGVVAAGHTWFLAPNPAAGALGGSSSIAR